MQSSTLRVRGIRHTTKLRRGSLVHAMVAVVALVLLLPAFGPVAQADSAELYVDGHPSDPTASGDLTPQELSATEAAPLAGLDVLSAADAAIQSPLPDVPLGVVGTFNFEEPLIKVNPANPNNIVLTSHRGMRVTADGGATFGPLVTFPNIGFSNGDTAMDFDSQGRLFWANLGGSSLEVTQMNPLTGAQIGATTVVGTLGFDDKEFLAADPYPASPHTDNLYLIWTAFPPASAVEVYFSRSTDQAVTWSTPLKLSDNFGGEGFPWPADVTVAPNGDVYASYHAGGSSGGVGTTWVLRSTDGGVTFPQKNLAFTAGQSDVTFNVQSSPGAIPKTQFWMQGSAQPWVLADPTQPGSIYVISNDDPDNVHGTSGDDADVVISRSTDHGMTWTVSTIPDGSGGAHQLFPFAAIDEGTGTIGVAWYDTRRALVNANGNFLLDVFATFSIDGGLTWAPDFMINDPTNPFDPDFPANQRRFPTPQISPCNAAPGSTETCRIGEYFGIDVRGDVMHLDWIGNTRDGAGNITGDQLFYSQVVLVIEEDADADGVNDDVDNCVNTPNPGQEDFDGDGVGDVCDLDVDGDLVTNGRDLCAWTVLPEPEPSKWRKNRYIVDASGNFVDPNGREAGITVADTHGCSGAQIVAALGLPAPHARFGITKSALLDWVDANGEGT